MSTVEDPAVMMPSVQGAAIELASRLPPPIQGGCPASRNILREKQQSGVLSARLSARPPTSGSERAKIPRGVQITECLSYVLFTTTVLSVRLYGIYVVEHRCLSVFEFGVWVISTSLP